MEIENLCEQCNKVTEHPQKINCGHFICPDCLASLIFVENLGQLSLNEEVKVSCKCKSGMLQLSLPDIQHLLSLCTDNKCANQNSRLKSQLHRIDKISEKFKDNIALTTKRTNEKIDSLIETLEAAKVLFTKKMAHVNENEDKLISILKMFYSKDYSSEKCMATNDIHFLKDLAAFKYYLSDLKMSEGVGNAIYNFHKSIIPLNTYLTSLTHPLHACWTNDQCWKNTITIQIRYSPVMVSVIQLKDGRIACGCENGTIKVWEVSVDGLDHAFDARDQNRSIFALIQLRDGRVVSGSADSTIKIWNVKDFKNPQTLAGHTSCVYAVIELQDGRIASGSWDNTIKIWEEVDSVFQNTLTLTGHTGQINKIIQLKDGRLVSGSYDQTMRIWEIKEKDITNVCTFAGEEWLIHLIFQMKDGRVITVSTNKMLRLWDITDGFANLCTFPLDSFNFYSIRELEGGRLLAAVSDHTIKFWEVTGNQVINTMTLTGHNGYVYSVILLQDGRLASISEDRTLKIWDSCVFSFQ